MLDTLNRDDILVADRFYPSYRTLAALLERGIDIVSISHHARRIDFSAGVQLGENDHIVEWHKPRSRNGSHSSMSREEYDRLPDTIPVREFVIEIEGRSGGSEQAVVVSSITDPNIPQKELADLYWRRWNCELDLRSIKQSMHLDVLRCKSPAMVVKEIFAHLLAYNSGGR